MRLYGLAGEKSERPSIIARVTEQVVTEAAGLREPRAPTQTTLFEGTDSTESASVVQVGGGTKTISLRGSDLG